MGLSWHGNGGDNILDLWPHVLYYYNIYKKKSLESDACWVVLRTPNNNIKWCHIKTQWGRAISLLFCSILKSCHFYISYDEAITLCTRLLVSKTLLPKAYTVTRQLNHDSVDEFYELIACPIYRVFLYKFPEQSPYNNRIII